MRPARPLPTTATVRLASWQQHETLLGRRRVHTCLLQRADADGIAQIVPLAAQLAGVVADASEDPGEGHGLAQRLPGFFPGSVGHLDHEAPGVHVQRAGGYALGRLLLDAPVLVLLELALVHVTVALFVQWAAAALGKGRPLSGGCF